MSLCRAPCVILLPEIGLLTNVILCAVEIINIIELAFEIYTYRKCYAYVPLSVICTKPLIRTLVAYGCTDNPHNFHDIQGDIVET